MADLVMTADRRLAAALATTAWKDRIVLLQDWAGGAPS
jgi:hypothetical protein